MQTNQHSNKTCIQTSDMTRISETFTPKRARKRFFGVSYPKTYISQGLAGLEKAREKLVRAKNGVGRREGWRSRAKGEKSGKKGAIYKQKFESMARALGGHFCVGLYQAGPQSTQSAKHVGKLRELNRMQKGSHDWVQGLASQLKGEGNLSLGTKAL